MPEPPITSSSVAGDASVFPVLASCVFLDHAAVAPLPQPVADAMRVFVDDWSQRGPQPWAYHRIARLRDVAARMVGAAGADEIAIMPNTSTGLATVAAGLGLGAGDAVVTTAVEFPSNRYVWEDRVRDGLRLVVAPAADDGRIVHDTAVLAAMDEAFTGISGTRLLAISHVQFASGQRHDLARLAEAARRHGALVCVDAIQSVGQMPVQADAWGIDFLSADGHKWMLGPEGTGILRVARAQLDRVRPPIVGWLNTVHAMDYDRYDLTLAPTARRFEPGCHSMVGVVGLVAALELLLGEGIERIEARITSLASDLAERIRRAGGTVVSPHEPGAGSGIVAVEPPPGLAAERVQSALADRDVRVAARRGLVRFSPHFYNTAAQMESAAEAFAACRS